MDGSGVVQEQLPALLSAIVGDAFGVRGWLMGNLAGAGFAIAAQKLLRRRLEQARDILLDELRQGERTLSDPEVEDSIAILLRYGRAAQEGTARLNLRLMAKVIAGETQYRILYAHEFLRYADILAGLRREEIILLGTLHRHWHTAEMKSLGDGRRQQAVCNRARTELIPNPFKEADDFYAAAEAVTRTALVRTADAIDEHILIQPTRLLDDLCALAPFEAAVSREST